MSRSNDDLRQVMGTLHGRRVIWRLLQAAQPRPVFSQNAMVMAGNASLLDYAQREIADWLAEACPDERDRMVKENR